MVQCAWLWERGKVVTGMADVGCRKAYFHMIGAARKTEHLLRLCIYYVPGNSKLIKIILQLGAHAYLSP